MDKDQDTPKINPAAVRAATSVPVPRHAGSYHIKSTRLVAEPKQDTRPQEGEEE